MVQYSEKKLDLVPPYSQPILSVSKLASSLYFLRLSQLVFRTYVPVSLLLLLHLQKTSMSLDDSFSSVNSSAVIPTIPYCDPAIKATIWKNIEVLGLIDSYESIIASVGSLGYEFMEDYVLKMRTGEWAKPML